MAFKLIMGLLLTSFGLFLSTKIYKKHKKIDTESIAKVKEIVPLGYVDGAKTYAVKYDVLSSEPFELLETPTKKKQKIGAQRTVFYEKGNANKNYYFKTIGQFDKRFFVPVSMVLIGILAIIFIKR